MDKCQTSAGFYRRDAVVSASVGLIALLTGGIFVPSVGITFSRDLARRLLGREGMESDSFHFDDDAHAAIRQATAKILDKKA